MTSGFYITIFIPICLAIFAAWEFLQLYRRRKGNKSALTNSQYVVRKAREGSRFYAIYIWAYPILIALIGIVLLFHWNPFCVNWGVLCNIDF